MKTEGQIIAKEIKYTENRLDNSKFEYKSDYIRKDLIALYSIESKLDCKSLEQQYKIETKMYDKEGVMFDDTKWQILNNLLNK